VTELAAETDLFWGGVELLGNDLITEVERLGLHALQSTEETAGRLDR
jgi:hypothetical protein